MVLLLFESVTRLPKGHWFMKLQWIVVFLLLTLQFIYPVVFSLVFSFSFFVYNFFFLLNLMEFYMHCVKNFDGFQNDWQLLWNPSNWMIFRVLLCCLFAPSQYSGMGSSIPGAPEYQVFGWGQSSGLAIKCPPLWIESG